jgi:hypothetical protein
MLFPASAIARVRPRDMIDLPITVTNTLLVPALKLTKALPLLDVLTLPRLSVVLVTTVPLPVSYSAALWCLMA